MPPGPSARDPGEGRETCRTIERVKTMSIPTKEYYDYREQIQAIVAYGSKEQLEALYRMIMARYGRDDDLYRLDDMYNHKWTIL